VRTGGCLGQWAFLLPDSDIGEVLHSLSAIQACSHMCRIIIEEKKEPVWMLQDYAYIFSAKFR
jgi:hypothetical protein